MGFEFKYEYFSCYYEDDSYYLDFPENIDKKDEKIIFEYLFNLNKVTLGICDENNYKEILLNNNVVMLIFDRYIVLYKTIGTNKNGFIVNEIEGIVFSKDKIRSVWFYIEYLIKFIYSDYFYDFQDKKVITEECLLNIKSFIDEDEIFEKMYKELKKNSIPYNFVLSSVKPMFFNNVFFENRQSNVVWNDNEWCNLSNLIKIPKADLDNELMRGRIIYKLPSMKNRPKVEGYLKERKVIKKQKKEKRVFWYIEKGCDERAKKKAASYLEHEKIVEFNHIEKEFEKK